jgi:hypothetical protein
MPENTVKVDRTTPWGNPFVVGKHGTRSECIRLHAILMAGNVCLSTRNAREQMAHYEYVVAHRRELAGRNLACWCSLPKDGEPDLCHAAVLLEISNR